MKRLAAPLLLVALLAGPARGQNDIARAVLFWLPDQREGLYAEIELRRPLRQAPAAAEVRLTTLPSKTRLSVSAVRLTATKDTLIVLWDAAVTPRLDDTQFEIRIEKVIFAERPEAGLSATGPLYARANLSQLIEQREREFQEAIAHAKTAQEKNLFAGLSVAAPTSGQAAGDAEIHLNRWVRPNGFVSLNVNRSSADKADPKHFDVGFTLRSVHPFLLGRTDSAEKPAKQVLRDKDAQAAAGRWLLGLLIDGAGRLEGDAASFRVTNAVFDLPIQLASRTMGFGELGRNGYWQFRLMPAGVEAGYNLGSEDRARENYRIARFKYGLILGLVYQPKDEPNAFPQRAVLDLQAGGRHLFENESAWDAAKKQAVSIASGYKPWYQVDAKIFLIGNQAGRVGFKLTFIRGSLPPIFTETRAFRFGLVFETTDDRSSQGQPLK